MAADEPFFTRKYRRPILLALMVATFNQLSGINALIYYTADIFAMAGAGRTSALWQSVTIGVTNLVFTLLAMTRHRPRRTQAAAAGRLARAWRRACSSPPTPSSRRSAARCCSPA